jgi:AcrR family transcriptional regulator
MDAIAARARASKATLYRRWSSKAELVVEAIKARGARQPELPDTGEIREDLLAGLRLMVAHIEKDDLGLMSGLVNAMRGDPELAAVIQNRVMADKREAAREWTQRAIDRGQLPASADTELFNDVAPAMVFMRLMMCGLPVDEPFLARIVDDVLLPLLTRAT